VYLRVADDTSSVNQVLPRFELWLDQENPIGAFCPESADLRSNERERDEREIGNHEIERSAKFGGIRMTDVQSFDNNNARIAANPLVKLTVTHIERDHLGGSTLQKTVGEPSG
jgi:hypothetical protein